MKPRCRSFTAARRSLSASWCASYGRGATSPSCQCPVQVVSEDRDPSPLRRVATPRPQREQRPAVDLVIATKFPTYFVRHPHKVTWLVHQYRAAYELCGTPYSDFLHNESDVGLSDTLMRLDTEMLLECRAPVPNARTTAARLEKFNGLQRRALYHPPRLAPRLVPGEYGDYVLSVGRIESVKRVDLVVRAMARTDPRCDWSSQAKARNGRTSSASLTSRASTIGSRFSAGSTTIS